MLRKHLETIAAAEVARTLAALPEPVREAAEGCSIELEWMEQAAPLEAGLAEDLLGLFEGQSYEGTEAASGVGDLPRIRLFLDNLWGYAGKDRSAFREEVRVTLLHELGHFLGLDEAQVEDRGLA